MPLRWGGKQGAVCDGWAYNVGTVPSLRFICSPKGGGQGRAVLGSICQDPRRELCTAHLEEGNGAHPQADLTKVRDAAEKYGLPLPQPPLHPSLFDPSSYFSHFGSCCALPAVVIFFSTFLVFKHFFCIPQDIPKYLLTSYCLLY